MFYHEGGETLEQFSQRSCGYSSSGRVQGQVGLGFEQPGLVEGVPVLGRGIRTRWSLMVPSNPNHSVIP